MQSDWLDLGGKVVVVTGGASGIGYGIVESFLEAGSRVLVLDRNVDACAKAAATLSTEGIASVRVCDVARSEDVNAAADHLLNTFGPCDVLVNNAGILRPGSLETLALEDWRQLLDVNLTGTFLCSQTFGHQ